MKPKQIVWLSLTVTVCLAAAVSAAVSSLRHFLFAFVPMVSVEVWLLSRYFGLSPLKQTEARNPQSLDTIYEQEFQKHGIDRSEFVNLWNTVASKLEVDPTKLRPSDRFDIELCARTPLLILDDELIQLTEWFHQEVQRSGRPMPKSKFDSIGDLVIWLLSPKSETGSNHETPV